MKHFINERSAIVSEAIEAAVLLGDAKVALLDGLPAIKVLVRTDWDRDRVAIISGGGSGHEPSHGGWVGEGLLTAAVCGEIFASPSVDAVLAAILAVTGPAGCLLVVKNYTGDRLNFGLAAERARALGLDVETVIVADDVALPDVVHPRGIAGTLFVHKVAGHVARSGAPLAEVKAAAHAAIGAIASIGVALTSCTIPGQPAESRIAAGGLELGLGIHGEPGSETMPIASVREIVRTMTTALESALDARAERGAVALLVNDLGGVPPIEMAITTREAVLAMKREVKLVLGPDRLMTSLDMKGFSLSAIALTDEIEEALRSEVGPRGWPVARSPSPRPPLALPAALARPPRAPSRNDARRHVVMTICEALEGAERELDTLDAKVGDGDTGTTFATAARAVRRDLDLLPFDDAPSLCAAIADRLTTVMGGSSGILLSILVAAMASALRASPDTAAALLDGVARMQEHGGAREGDRTMIDALAPAARALAAAAAAARTPAATKAALAAAAAEAQRGAERTKAMTKARAGRSTYVREELLRGIADPGAVAVARVFEALAASHR